MEDSVIRIPRQSCCRLCLAPDSECVSIFGTRAADKQPISQKIQACVNIQVNASDRLSGRICHGCISFLNSWTSFKGRCGAAQRQQKSWLAGQLKRQLGLQANSSGEQLQENGEDDDDKSGEQPSMDVDETEAYNYYPQYHRMNLKPNRNHNHSTSKDDDDSGPVTVNMELDPTQFLAGGDDDDDEEDDDNELEEGEFVEPSSKMLSSSSQNRNHLSNNAPQILQSLGLRNVNPMSMLATDFLMQNNEDIDDEEGGGAGGLAVIGAPGSACRLCGMGFSNRANARRHERNIHGLQTQEGDTDSGRTSVNGNATPSGSSSQAATPSKPNAAAAPLKPVERPRAVFDYSEPEKHRHLLTEARMMFIRRNTRFLYQYQDMTCKCCDRKYFTYKTFMAHMRKKYTTLPRNVCFTCLRKFESKGQFIAHLKKRNCMNMFTLFMADQTIPKDARFLAQATGGTGGGAAVAAAMAAEAALNTGTGGVGAGSASALNMSGEGRIGLKDLLTNKTYACQICQQQVRVKQEFRGHLNSAHPESGRDPVTGNCRHCLASFTDKAERKRHFSTLDCMVQIICTTCDKQFETNTAFLDHVYGTHLKELNAADDLAAQINTERLADEVKIKQELGLGAETGHGHLNHSHSQLMPKKNAGCVCPVCQKQYNNYYNVLWHFESKHPEYVPKTYKCEICEEMFTKQQLLKSHVKEEHADALTASSGGSEGGTAAAVGNYPCRHCDETLTKATDYIAHQLRAHPDEELLACHECEFVTEEKEKLEEHLRGQHLNLLKLRVLSCTACKQSFVTEEALKYHQMVQHAENESSEQTFKRMLKVAKIPKIAIPVVRKMEPSDDLYDEMDMGGDVDDSLLQDKSFMARVKYEESQRVRECPICMDKYHVLAEFIAHMKGHMAVDNVTNLDLEPGKSRSGAYHSRMRCRMCEKRISSKVGYKRHLLEEHGVNDCKIVQCDLCPGEFSNDKGLKVHLYRTHNINIREDGEVITGMQVMPPTTGDSQFAAVAARLGLKQPTIEYECQICHTVYRSVALLKSHVGSVHQLNDFDAYLQQYGNGEVITPQTDDPQQQQLDAMSLMMMSGLMDGDEPGTTGGGTDYTPIEVYFQCRYCDDNFASRQKLTAHMNTHEEHDPTDYTCRECGNSYQSRKSLWVHRNKKHPRSQVPSPCEVCKKVFFDKTELVYHLKTHVAQKMELMNELMSAAQNGGMDEGDMDESEGSEGEEMNGEEGAKKYDCHVCERKFRDPGKLSQHLRFHEMQNNMFVLGAFTEAGMDDEGGAGGGAGGAGMNGGGGNEATGDPFEPQYNDDGTEEYQCDMCPKKFSQLMALRVHRGWHYRSPDGRQITEPGQTWQPGSLRSQRGSKSRSSITAAAAPVTATLAAAVPSPAAPPAAAAENNNQLNITNNNNNSSALHHKGPKCQFCSSTFASSNNLRRHIVEVHKRNDFRSQATTASHKSQSGVSGGFVDRDRECTACSLTFETRAEWVEHKIGHAKVMRPSTTFEWNCEMCGKVFTRKERLLQHMAIHAQENGAGGVGQQQRGSGSENSRGTMDNERSRDGEEEDEEEGEFVEDEDDDEPMVVNPDVEMLNEDDDDFEEEEGDEEDGEYIQAQSRVEVVAVAEKKEVKNKALACDLCQKPFTDAGELRKHVLSHFFNGQQGEGASLVKMNSGSQQQQEKNKKKKEEAPPQRKIEEEEPVGGPQAKKAKIDIPEEEAKTAAVGGVDDQFEEDDEEEEGEYVQAQSRLEQTLGGDLSAGDATVNDEDLDEGEYVEDYIEEDSFASPKKATPPKGVVGVKTPVVITTTTTTASCRLCSSAYENNFKALKCMESHRQRSKYQCPECELYFATPKQLAGHEQLIHPGA